MDGRRYRRCRGGDTGWAARARGWRRHGPGPPGHRRTRAPPHPRTVPPPAAPSCPLLPLRGLDSHRTRSGKYLGPRRAAAAPWQLGARARGTRRAATPAPPHTPHCSNVLCRARTGATYRAAHAGTACTLHSSCSIARDCAEARSLLVASAMLQPHQWLPHVLYLHPTRESGLACWKAATRAASPSPTAAGWPAATAPPAPHLQRK